MSNQLSQACLAVALLGAVSVSSAEDWDWSVTPYFWLSDVSLDANINGNSAGTTVPIQDLLEKLELGGQVAIQGQRGAWGIFADLSFIALADSGSRDLGPDGGVLTIDGDLDQLIFDVGASYRLADSGKATWDVLFGARLIDVDITFDLSTGQRANGGGSKVDGFVGLRYMNQFSDRWLGFARVDAGGGGSDGDWQALVGAGRSFGKKGNKTFMMAWRELSFELDGRRADALSDVDLGYSGPVLGVKFDF